MCLNIDNSLYMCIARPFITPIFGIEDSGQFTKLEVLLCPLLLTEPQLTLSEHSNCVYNDSDDSTIRASKNCNTTMTCSLGLDSEEVENMWIYFRFHQNKTGRIITANCEPRKKERNVNYNWEIYRDEKADCKLEIPNAGDDDVGNYECGILEVTHVNSVNSVAKSQARSFVIFDEAVQSTQDSNFPVETVAGSVGGSVVGVVLLAIVIVASVGWLTKGRKKHQEGGLQEEQDRGPEEELGAGKRLHCHALLKVQTCRQLTPD